MQQAIYIKYVKLMLYKVHTEKSVSGKKYKTGYVEWKEENHTYEYRIKENVLKFGF